MKTKDLNNLVNKIYKICNFKKTGLHEPVFSQEEIKSLKKSIQSTMVSTTGGVVDKFEKKLKNFVKSKHCIATINGTSALHISLLLVGVKRNDEVLVPPFSFVATANSILYCDAIPHFVDINEKNLGIDPDKLYKYLKSICKKQNGYSVNKKTGNIIRAIMPVHVFGHPADIEKIVKISNHFNIKIIEDAAEALGSYYKNKHLGTFGDVGILSFNGNKIITTGAGGAIITNKNNLAKKARHLIANAKINHPWNYEHDQIGFNYRMPSLNAALGCAQIDKIKIFLKKKKNLYKKYKKELAQFNKDFIVMNEPIHSRSNFWLNTIILNNNKGNLKRKILISAHKKGIRLRPIWNPINTFKHFKKYPKMKLSNVDKFKDRIINLPSGLNILK